MFGKNARVNSLESKKQLLIAESEINRAQLLEDWQTISDEVRDLSNRARSVGSLVSMAALVASSVSAFRQKKSETKHSWVQTTLKAAQSIGSIWLAWRARER
jgi:hypothetical protein